MQPINLLAIGRLKESWAREASAMYEQRIRALSKFQPMELSASKGRTSAQQQVEESQRVLVMLQKIEGEKWILDERGQSMTTAQFATLLGRARDSGTPLTFALGGAYGFTDNVRKVGYKMLRLSDMTLPHELARVVFLEQLYRALDLNRGGAYHHA